MYFQSIQSLNFKVDSLIDLFNKNSAAANEVNKMVDNNFTLLDDKIEEIKGQLSGFHSDTMIKFKEVKMELIKINNATNYLELENNLSVVKGNRTA